MRSGINTLRMLAGGKASGRVKKAGPKKKTGPKKKPRPLKAVLAGALMGRTIDFLEGRWKNDLWRP